MTEADNSAEKQNSNSLKTKNFTGEMNNSLTSLVQGIYNSPFGSQAGGGEQLSQTDTLFINNRWYLISNFRQLLSQLYVEHGVVQTLVDQPVDDAFRSGITIKSGEFSGDDIEKLMVYVERNCVMQTIMQGQIWARLFGGGGIIIITDQDPITPLDLDTINEKTPLKFRAVDMWELYNTDLNVNDDSVINGDDEIEKDAEFYNYYGKKIHHSRVYRLEGKEPPSFIRPRLRGWGMSVIERLVRSLNQYMKNQDVAFALLDEAKVDIFKMKNFNSALATSEGTTQVANRIQMANQLKNYNNALTMDSEDEYDQKQVTFTGLSDMLIQIRQGLAADLKMPMTKLFGISAAGFNSGEDDIENYNSMIESEIRSKVKYAVVDILQICSRKVFGFAPDDLSVKFNPLRILSAKEEEEVKNSQFNRTIASYTSGLISDTEAKEMLNTASLLPSEIDENAAALPPVTEGDDYTVKEGAVT